MKTFQAAADVYMSSLQLDNTVSSWLDAISEIIKQREYPRSHKKHFQF